MSCSAIRLTCTNRRHLVKHLNSFSKLNAILFLLLEHSLTFQRLEVAFSIASVPGCRVTCGGRKIEVRL